MHFLLQVVSETVFLNIVGGPTAPVSVLPQTLLPPTLQEFSTDTGKISQISSAWQHVLMDRSQKRLCLISCLEVVRFCMPLGFVKRLSVLAVVQAELSLPTHYRVTNQVGFQAEDDRVSPGTG